MTPEIRSALEATPRCLEALVSALEPEDCRLRPEGHPFSLGEHLWHLADLETDAFQVRILRLQGEKDPRLSDFDGDRAARLKDYASLDPSEGLRRFVAARAHTLALLDAVAPADWERAGVQEGVGPVRLAQLPGRILAHDRAHLRELRALLAALDLGHLGPQIPGGDAPMEVCA